MNKYRDKSDFEINELVSFRLGYIHTKSFDPCNNPAHAMPIIIENSISMVRIEWSARQFNNHCIEVNDSNYFRAAMICFLMMKDAENES